MYGYVVEVQVNSDCFKMGEVVWECMGCGSVVLGDKRATAALRSELISKFR
jgi:hypothetical protein